MEGDGVRDVSEVDNRGRRDARMQRESKMPWARVTVEHKDSRWDGATDRYPILPTLPRLA